MPYSLYIIIQDLRLNHFFFFFKKNSVKLIYLFLVHKNVLILTNKCA